MTLLAVSEAQSAVALVELGLVLAGLALLARIATRLGITAVPLYLIAGLTFGNGGLVEISVSEAFIGLVAEIGVLLLLLTLGLEYTSPELRDGLRSGAGAGVADAALNALPGVAVGLMLGWSMTAAVLLGGVAWVSSSGIASKVLEDLGRLKNVETPAIFNVSIIEDLAMAIYLPIVAAVIADQPAAQTTIGITVALSAAVIGFWFVSRYGKRLSDYLIPASNEAFLLSVLGIMLVVAGVAQQLQISSAIGAFLVGLGLSGVAQERASELLSPLRDLFAAIFFVSFSFQIAPSELQPVLIPALVLAVVTGVGKVVTGWIAAGRYSNEAEAKLRVGTTLIARGEFSIVIAALGATLVEGRELSALAAAYVLLTAVGGTIATKHADRLAAVLGRHDSPDTKVRSPTERTPIDLDPEPELSAACHSRR